MLEGAHVAVTDAREAPWERTERLVLLRLSGRGESRQGTPVERPQGGDDNVTARTSCTDRASLIAHSFASAPEFEKKTWPPAAVPSPTRRSRSQARRSLSSL